MPHRVRGFAHFIALLLGVVLSACSIDAALALETVPGAQPGGSVGCASAAPRTGSFTLGAPDGKSRPRTFLMDVPADYAASHRYPLVFVFHGAGTSGQQSHSWGLQNAAGARGKAIFVFPNGIAYRSDGVGWDDGADGYDLPFFDAMVRQVEAGYCIDPGLIFVAGFSWGGDFAIALACHRGDGIRAVAANSTDDEFKNTSDYRTYNGLPCGSRRHPPVRFGHAVGGDKEYPAPDFATTSKLFRYMNACGDATTTVPASSGAMSCVSYNACAAEYTECSFDTHIGHALPPNWAQDTWDYFSRFFRQP